MNFSIDDVDLQSKIQQNQKIIIMDGSGNLYELKPYVDQH